MSLDAVPSGLKLDEVSAFLLRQPGASAIDDLYIWPMSTTDTALTCHCVMTAGHPGDEYLAALAHEFPEHVGIGHATIQIEVQEHVACALEPAHVV